MRRGRPLEYHWDVLPGHGAKVMLAVCGKADHQMPSYDMNTWRGCSLLTPWLVDEVPCEDGGVILVPAQLHTFHDSELLCTLQQACNRLHCNGLGSLQGVKKPWGLTNGR